LTPAQIKAFRLADNKTAEFSVWDDEMLKVELEELGELNFDLDLTGFDENEINKLTSRLEVEEDDFDVDANLPEEPITKRGDIWLIGKHRLICGDSTSEDDISKLMGKQDADLVLTDPPYNVNYGSKAGMLNCYDNSNRNTSTILNDNMSNETFLQFLTDAFTRMYEHSKKGAAIYVFHSDVEGYNFRSAFKTAGYQLRECLVWIKNCLVMGRQDYQWQHEPILYGWKDGASHAWYSDRKQTTLVKFDKPQKNDLHPTMKPIGLCGYFIANSSKEGDIVLDTFGGSGSTLIACEQIGRSCYMSELDPKYCDVIIKRWEQFTGGTAEMAAEHK
jgi:DNA modification methylase